MEKIETDPTLATGYSEKSPTESCLMTLDMYDWNQRTLRALTQIFFQALVSTFSPFPSIWAIPGDLHEPMQQALFLHLVFYIVTFFILFLHWLTRSQSLSHVWLLVTQRSERARLPCSSLSPEVCIATEAMMPSTISSSVVPFSSCPQSFPASGSFQMSQFFASGGQSIGVSASASAFQWIFRVDFL